MQFLGKKYCVLIVSASEKGTEYITTLLAPEVFFSVISNNISEAKRLVLENSFDIIIINTPLPDEFGTEFALDASLDTNAGIMLLVKSEYADEISERMGAHGVVTVAKPTSRQMLTQAIRILCATRERLKKLEKKNETLKEKMDEIRIVNRAKWALIEYLKMSESEAHHYIEKQAMDMRITKRKAAENIIKTYEY